MFTAVDTEKIVSFMNKYHISFLSYLFLCQHFIRFVLSPFAQCCNIKCRSCVLAHVLPHANSTSFVQLTLVPIFPSVFPLFLFCRDSFPSLVPYLSDFFLLIQFSFSYSFLFAYSHFSPPCFPILFYHFSNGFCYLSPLPPLNLVT